mmetsp:Transcript_17875/g.38639  ORF Transcript_17875/g.38639 Transcript_17875/m.38639 type:complete len:204 (+) Transcript_17875:388-999(+)
MHECCTSSCTSLATLGCFSKPAEPPTSVRADTEANVAKARFDSPQELSQLMCAFGKRAFRLLMKRQPPRCRHCSEARARAEETRRLSRRSKRATSTCCRSWSQAAPASRPPRWLPHSTRPCGPWRRCWSASSRRGTCQSTTLRSGTWCRRPSRRRPSRTRTTRSRRRLTSRTKSGRRRLPQRSSVRRATRTTTPMRSTTFGAW